MLEFIYDTVQLSFPTYSIFARFDTPRLKRVIEASLQFVPA